MRVPTGTDKKFAEVEAATSKDKHGRPTLTEPWFKGGNLYATDSYVAVRIPVVESENDTEGSVPAAALKAARKSYSPLVDLDGQAKVTSAEGTLSMPRLHEGEDAQYPDIDAVINADAEGFSIGLSASKVGQVAKALGADGLRLTIQLDEDGKPSALKPVIVHSINGSDARVGLVMPIRLAGSL